MFPELYIYINGYGAALFYIYDDNISSGFHLNLYIVSVLWLCRDKIGLRANEKDGAQLAKFIPLLVALDIEFMSLCI